MLLGISGVPTSFALLTAVQGELLLPGDIFPFLQIKIFNFKVQTVNPLYQFPRGITFSQFYQLVAFVNFAFIWGAIFCLTQLFTNSERGTILSTIFTNFHFHIIP